MNLKKLLFSILLFPVLAQGAVYFDGDDRFECGSFYGGEKYFTVTAHIKTFNDNEESQVIASYGDSHGGPALYEMRIELDPDTGSGFTVYCEFLDEGGTYISVYADCSESGYCMELGVPYHLACVLTNSLQLIPYINGVAYTPLEVSIPLDTSYRGSFYVGMDAAGSNPAKDTQITDVATYSDSLEPALIESLGLSYMRNNIVPTNIRSGYWPFDDLGEDVNVGTKPMIDRTGNGNSCVAASSSEGGTAKADWVRYQ
ncbi:MAG: hypothetical protein E6Q97_09570 [Desulfurellales bacterium]|nr:MAG: hypothetical protein E6Q97_09570 [Desulfurellales bacterium]